MVKEKKIRVDEHLHEHLKALSKHFNVSMSNVIKISRDFFNAVAVIKNEENNEIKFDIYTRYDMEYYEIIKDLPIYRVRVIDYENKDIVDEIIEKDLIIIPSEIIHIHFDYPLSIPVIFDYENKRGFTRVDVFRCIYEGYSKIYKEELETGGIEEPHPDFCYNRARSEGKYGIYGHYLKDLHIEGIHYNTRTNEITLDIGS